MEIKFITRFQISDPVYHVTPESPKGIIIDISYSLLNKNVRYLVSFGWEDDQTVWCWENELLENKTF